MDELIAPCSYCGYGASLNDTLEPHYYVECDRNECQASGPMRNTPEEAIEVWNANARLASAAQKTIGGAAPELLDMLEMLCNGLEWNIENHPTIMNESDNEALTAARALLEKVKRSRD